MRTSIARLTAGTLVVLAACTGSPSSTSPPGSTSGAASPPPSTSGIARLADGQPLPTGCPTGTAARDETVAFVADGNAWVLDPASGDVSCLFAAPAPGPFTWNPRGDRALLNDLEIRSIHGVRLRAASPLPAAVTSWGHPIGKAVVYISPSGTRLRKIYPGTQRRDDITPVAHVHYLNVIYHPSGLAIAFVVDTGDGEEIWLSSNLGEDPVRLVFAVGGTRFGALDFSRGRDHPALRGRTRRRRSAPARDRPDEPHDQPGLCGTVTPGIGSPRSPTQPDPDGDLIALTVGATCEDSRAMVFRRGEQPQPLADAPSRIVGWLDGSTVLVATDGCDGPSNLVAIDSGQPVAVPLVTGIEIAAARTPLSGFVPPLPAGIQEAVGGGVG